MISDDKNKLKRRIQQLESEVLSLKTVYEERQNQLQKVNSHILHNLAGDLFISMNRIMGFCKETNQQAAKGHFTDQALMQKSMNNLMNLVQNFSVFADLIQDSIQQNEYPKHSEESSFNVEEFLSGIIDDMDMMVRGTNIKLLKKYISNIPSSLEGNSFFLRHALTSLLSNAFKFTREGYITLDIELLSQNEDLVWIRWKVKDTGRGMSDKKLEAIKTALQIENPMDMLMSDDIGLGLILVNMISREMKGLFGIQSTINLGTSCWIDTPLILGADKKEICKSVKHPYESENAKKILVVEDNYLNQKFIAAALSKGGHSLEIAENGKVAFEKYNKNNYDLILMDIQLPLIDGIETTMKIRRAEKKYKRERTPIIAVTAYAIEHDRVKCLEAGMDGYITKPFQSMEILRLVDEY